MRPMRALDTMMPEMNRTFAVRDTGGYLLMTVNSSIKKKIAGIVNTAIIMSDGVPDCPCVLMAGRALVMVHAKRYGRAIVTM